MLDIFLLATLKTVSLTLTSPHLADRSCFHLIFSESTRFQFKYHARRSAIAIKLLTSGDNVPGSRVMLARVVLTAAVPRLGTISQKLAWPGNCCHVRP